MKHEYGCSRLKGVNPKQWSKTRLPLLKTVDVIKHPAEGDENQQEGRQEDALLQPSQRQGSAEVNSHPVESCGIQNFFLNLLLDFFCSLMIYVISESSLKYAFNCLKSFQGSIICWLLLLPGLDECVLRCPLVASLNKCCMRAEAAELCRTSTKLSMLPSFDQEPHLHASSIDSLKVSKLYQIIPNSFYSFCFSFYFPELVSFHFISVSIASRAVGRNTSATAQSDITKPLREPRSLRVSRSNEFSQQKNSKTHPTAYEESVLKVFVIKWPANTNNGHIGKQTHIKVYQDCLETLFSPLPISAA